MSQHHNPDHVIVPIKTYVLVYIALILLTVLTVTIYYLDFGVLNLPIALTVAVIKSMLVIMIFMGLRWDKGFDRIAFFGSVVFVAIFIVFTLSDNYFRGRVTLVDGEVHSLQSPIQKPGAHHAEAE